MGKRYKTKRAPGHYVQRDKRGRFKKWTAVHRGIKVDARRKVAQKTFETGYGHVQDYRK